MMTIGVLASRTGVSIRAIRHYDDLGLLRSTRGANGYRHFPALAKTQVRQIQRLLGVGFSLEDIQSFPGCMLLLEGAKPCEVTTRAQRQRLARIERQIEELEAKRAQLLDMLNRS
jgi:MerR family transcriptional regulator, copper efflux regulator